MNLAVQNLFDDCVVLLSIDLQILDITPTAGLLATQPQSVIDSYLHRMETVVIPNVRQLQEKFRQHTQEVIHARIQSMTLDGRDRSISHKKLGIHVYPDDPMGHFIDDVAPKGDEMIFNKTASGVFNSTHLHYVLTNMNVSTIIVCGVFTDECVESTIRAGADLGYHMILISDACAAITPQRHQRTIDTLHHRYALACSTSDILQIIDQKWPSSRSSIITK